MNKFTYLNPEVTLDVNDETVLYNEEFYAIFERGLRAHAHECNDILYRWASNKIMKTKGTPKKFISLPDPTPCSLARMNAVLMDFPTE